MKLLMIPNTLNNIEKYIDNGVKGIIIGLKDLCTNFEVQLTIDEIKELVEKHSDIEIFVSMNKNLFNDELDKAEQALIELNKLNIKAVLYYDLSIIYLKNKNNLDLDLVWNQTHMVTNYNTCNYYYDQGVKYGYLSTEITLEEINEIKEKSNMKLIAFGFGYPIMAHSRRSLLTNYFKSINKEYDGKCHYISDKFNNFVIKEDKTGATFINNEFMNGSSIITDSKVDYIVFNNDLVDYDTSIKLVSLINNLIVTKNERLTSEIEDLIGNYTNFLFKKTVYVVKKNER